MSMKSLENEQRIITLFKEAKTVIYNGKIYQIIIAEKPQYHKGEGKTDIYLKLISDEDEQEVKITTKMTTAEFLENKVKPERAKVIFGENWVDTITNYALSIKDRFESCVLYNENENKCTAGWRIDITSRGKRKLSKRIEATKEFKQEILFGINLSEEKRHVKVADKLTFNAGVANYLLLNSEQYTTAQEIINAMQTIDEVELECYIAFCAVNYYIDKNKGESKRSLAVYVDWSSGEPIIVYDSPLTYTSTDIFNKIEELL